MARSDTFGKIATHPEASLQATEVGKTLHTLHLFEDKVLMGYGDYALDTGPITIRHYDTKLDAVGAPLITGSTHSFSRFVTVGDTVFALTTDPLERDPGGFVSWSSGDEAWQEQNSLVGLHFWDMTSFGNDENHLLLSGSGNPPIDSTVSFVYESVDGGNSWEVSLSLPVPEPTSQFDFSRFYGIGVVGDKAYVQHVQRIALENRWQPLSLYEFDGSQWSEGPHLQTESGETTLFIDPLVYGTEILVRNEHAGIALSPLFRFDGVTLRLAKTKETTLESWDQVLHDDLLYVLTAEDGILATSDFESWRTVIANVPEDGRSLAIAEDGIYIGALDASLYRLEPLSCDLKNDWICDTQDLDLLIAGIAGNANDPLLDVNADGLLDLLDRDNWLEQAATLHGFGAPYRLGDANLDGTVDAADLTELALHWQSHQIEGWSSGDFDADGFVGSSDLNILAQNWRGSISGGELRSQLQALVPEPSGFGRFLMAMILIVARAERRSQRSLHW